MPGLTVEWNDRLRAPKTRSHSFVMPRAGLRQAENLLLSDEEGDVT
jgi:hypothetical protein